jgi:hypothetical protein
VRAFAHVGACLLFVPQALLFAAIKLVDHVTRSGTLLGLLNTTFDTLDALLGWYGLAALIVAILLLAAGFSATWRPVASICLLAADVYTAVVLVTWTEVSSFADAAFFLAPGMIAGLIWGWLIRDGLRRESRRPLREMTG